MISIYFLHKLFAINILFIVNSSSVLSIPNCFDSLFGKTPKVYRMIMNKNKFESFEEYNSSTKPVEQNEKKLELDEYYNTVHNLQHIRIPGSTNDFDYNAYQRRLENYCEYDYDTFKTFRSLYQVRLFVTSVTNLKICINGVLKNDADLRKNMINGLQWKSNDFDNTLSMIDSVLNCLQSQKKSFVHCLGKMDSNRQKKWPYYTENMLNNLKTNIPAEKYDAFITCINNFKVGFENVGVIQTNKNITLMDVLLSLALIFHNVVINLNDINMKQLFTNYSGFEVIITSDTDRENCKKKMNAMDSIAYSRIKMSYLIFTELSNYGLFKNYVKNIRQTLIDLRNTDKNNSRFYKDLKNRIIKITEEDFKNMMKRRPMEGENYTAYVMRMNIKGYFPLPQNLWYKEKSIIMKREIVKFIEKE